MGWNYSLCIGMSHFLQRYILSSHRTKDLRSNIIQKKIGHSSRPFKNRLHVFSNRWILLCFKREFPESDALRMWEACWAHYQTDYFHLFLCVAIIAVYGEDVVQQDLPADEMLLHFSSLSMHMSGEVVLRKVSFTKTIINNKITTTCKLSHIFTDVVTT